MGNNRHNVKSNCNFGISSTKLMKFKFKFKYKTKVINIKISTKYLKILQKKFLILTLEILSLIDLNHLEIFFSSQIALCLEKHELYASLNLQFFDLPLSENRIFI